MYAQVQDDSYDAQGGADYSELQYYIAEDIGVPVERVPQFQRDQIRMQDLADELLEEFPDTVSGIWMDDDYNINIGTSEEADVEKIAQLTGINRVSVQKYSFKELEEYANTISDEMIASKLDKEPRISVKTSQNSVVVEKPSANIAGRRVSDSSIDNLILENDVPSDSYYVVDKDEDIEEASCADGRDCFPYLRSGIHIKLGNKNCTSGFVAKNRKNENYLLTAGHCGTPGTVVTNDVGTRLGVITGSIVSSGHDSARIFIDNNAWQRTRWARMSPQARRVAIVGQKTLRLLTDDTYVCHAGRTSGSQCGWVDRKYTEENRPRWKVNMLCKKGDSGGGAFMGEGSPSTFYAVGIVTHTSFHSNGKHHCFGQDISDVLNRHNLTLVTS